MLSRSLVVWLGLLVFAIAPRARSSNHAEHGCLGGTRHQHDHPLRGDPLAVAADIGWIGPRSSGDWAIGGLWFGLTVAFEFLGGHYLFGNPWSRLLEDSTVFRGRVWVVVLLTTALAPLLCARARGLIPPQHEIWSPQG